jgi:hypothetical protein
LATAGVTTRTSSAASMSSRTPKGSASALSAASPAAISKRVGIAGRANHALADVALPCNHCFSSKAALWNRAGHFTGVTWRRED